jgi:sigma-B regulation protein RsbU (phosphoserine phosphatase)
LTATIARGGHPPPYRVRAAGGVEAVGAPGVLLGAFANGGWAESRVALAPGDLLVFYTDGVTDTLGADDERFGHERLEELLEGATGVDADELASRVDEALQAFERGVQRDDVALLVLRVTDR